MNVPPLGGVVNEEMIQRNGLLYLDAVDVVRIPLKCVYKECHGEQTQEIQGKLSKHKKCKKNNHVDVSRSPVPRIMNKRH